MADLTVINHGSVFLLMGTSLPGKQWIVENIPEDAQRWGRSIVVEHRYIAAIVEGAMKDGLEVE